MKHSSRPAALLVLWGVLFAPSPARASSVPPWETGESRGEDLAVSLVTFGPGSELESWWGHAALVVEDRRLHQGRLYNYGMFSFDEKMWFRFAMGRLEFWVGEADVGLTLYSYAAENRTVHIQELNLLPPERVQIAKALADNVLPQNRGYLYDHYRDNCASRPRDMIDRAVGGQLSAATSGPGRYTLREHTQRYTSVNPAMSVFLDFMMSGSIDGPLTQKGEAFLPDELEAQVASLKFKNAAGQVVPLTLGTRVFSSSTRPPVPASPPSYSVALLALGFGLGALALLLGFLTGRGSRLARVALGVYQALLALPLGVVGTVLIFMWIVTNHWVTFHNENLFLANPFTLLVVGRGLSLARGKRRDAGERLFRAWRLLIGIAVLGLLLKLLPWFHQNNVRLIELLLPFELGFFAAAHLARRDFARASLLSELTSRPPLAKGRTDSAAGSL